MSELEQLRRELDDEVAARVEAGLCGCGCGTLITIGGNGRRKYVDQAHRQRRYRHALRRLAAVEGISTRVSLRLVEEANATHHRNGDAQTKPRKPRRRRSPDLRISYRKAVEIVGSELQRAGLVNPAGKERIVAELWLRPLLSDAAKKVVLPPSQRKAAA